VLREAAHAEEVKGVDTEGLSRGMVRNRGAIGVVVRNRGAIGVVV
jgi:hypothetical protein